MATKLQTELTVDQLIHHGFFTRDPTAHKGLASERKVGPGVSILEIASEYHTARTDLMFCYICGRRNHNHGFIGRINEADHILIGNCCAAKIVNQAFLTTAKRQFDARKNRYHYTSQAREIMEQIEPIRRTCAPYRRLCLTLDELRTSMELQMPRAFLALRSSIKQYGSRLISHEWRENPRFKESNQGQRYIAVPLDLGTIRGAAYLTGGRRLEIILYELEASLTSLSKVANDTNRSVDSERFVSRFRIEIKERGQALDALLMDAIAFFEVSNLLAVNAWFVHQTGEDLPEIVRRLDVERNVSGKLQKLVEEHELSIPQRTLTKALSWGNYGGSNLTQRRSA